MPNFCIDRQELQPSPKIDAPCQNCDSTASGAAVTNPTPPIKMYKVKVVVQTRERHIPMTGLSVFLDDAELGKTDESGVSPESALRVEPEAKIKVIYQNTLEKLKSETYEQVITGIDAQSGAYTAGMAVNTILKIQDVLGVGGPAMAGDIDFQDEYSAAQDVKIEDTENPDIKLLTVQVHMATFSLSVPYLSQIGDGERIQVSSTRTHLFAGYMICMPTSAKMAVDYWGITNQDKTEISRNQIMQTCWDKHWKPTIVFPSPWQGWDFLRKIIGKMASHEGFSVTDTNDIDAMILKGLPVVASTYATEAGHVVCLRGGVYDHRGKIHWRIYNDPYGSLATDTSIYGRLDLQTSVGFRGDYEGEMNDPNDVANLQDILRLFNYYHGEVNGEIDETNIDDPTIQALKAFQGGGSSVGRADPNGYTEKRVNQWLNSRDNRTYRSSEREINEVGIDNARGKHVYYNNRDTEKHGPYGLMKGQVFTLVITPSKPLDIPTLTQKLVPHQM